MIIYNNIIPFKGYLALNLFGVIFIRNKVKTFSEYYQKVILNHEQIHTKQYQELGYILFLPWYVLEYLIKLCISWNFKKAYRSVSFEQEANQFETKKTYLEKRKHYFWLQFVFKMWQ